MRVFKRYYPILSPSYPLLSSFIYTSFTYYSYLIYILYTLLSAVQELELPRLHQYRTQLSYFLDEHIIHFHIILYFFTGMHDSCVVATAEFLPYGRV
jgi:hypothetical protein